MTNGAIVRTTNYLPTFETENGVLNFIYTPEGRAVPMKKNSYEYQYFLKDHLGNTCVVLSQTGRILQQNSYYPFGMLMSGLPATNTYTTNKYLYNGKELQDDFDLDWYDYGARFYDAGLGRFHTMDPLQQFHSPYNFTGDNPINNTDPSGMYSYNWTTREYENDVISSSFVDPTGTLIEHRDDGDPKVYLVKDVDNWRKKGSKKEDAEHVGYEYPRIDYFSMVGQKAVYFESNSPYFPGFLNDGPIEEDYTLELLFIPLPTFAFVKLGRLGGKLLWGFWDDFAKVVFKGKIYAKIGGRLYSRHAVERMLPRVLGKAARGEAGRSIPTNIVEEVIKSGNKTTRLVEGVVRTEHVLGNVSVVTEKAGKIVVTVMIK